MTAEDMRARICEEYPTLCPHFSEEFGDGVLDVPPDLLRAAAANLRSLGFDRLGMVTAVDEADDFVLVYRLQSRNFRTGLFLKAKLPKSDPVTPSFVDLWPAADWQEREVYDMFGIRFEGHPDLRRILLPEDWNGHPLRKDYEDEHIVKRPDYV